MPWMWGGAGRQGDQGDEEVDDSQDVCHPSIRLLACDSLLARKGASRAWRGRLVNSAHDPDRKGSSMNSWPCMRVGLALQHCSRTWGCQAHRDVKEEPEIPLPHV